MQNRINLIKSIHQNLKRKKINNNLYSSFNNNNKYKKVETIAVDNAPFVDWKKECDDITKDIQEQIFG